MSSCQWLSGWKLHIDRVDEVTYRWKIETRERLIVSTLTQDAPRESTWRARLRQRAVCLTICELISKESNCDRGHDRGSSEDSFEKEARSSTLNFPVGLPKLSGQSSLLAVQSHSGGFRFGVLAWLLWAVCLFLFSLVFSLFLFRGSRLVVAFALGLGLVALGGLSSSFFFFS